MRRRGNPEDFKEVAVVEPKITEPEDPFEIPDFMKKQEAAPKKVEPTTIGSVVLHPPQETWGTLETVVPTAEETRKPRKEYKFRKDVAILKGLGWSQSQLNKLDRHTASDYAAHLKNPPPKYSRSK